MMEVLKPPSPEAMGWEGPGNHTQIVLSEKVRKQKPPSHHCLTQVNTSAHKTNGQFRKPPKDKNNLINSRRMDRFVRG